MQRRRLLIAAAVLGGAGLVLAAVLVREHALAHAGFVSFCSINDLVNCDRVATSRFSVVLGLPIAVWGVFGYGIAVVLALAGLRRGKASPTWPGGLLLLVGAAASAVAVALAIVSERAVGALCLLCSASWLVSFALFAVAWRACRPEGVRQAVGADLAVIRARPARTAVVAIAGLAAIALVAAAYPRYWERKATAARAAAPAGPAVPASQEPFVVVEFSDYECPFCAQAHEETKALLASRPTVTLVRRQFPLDSDCNPAVKRRMHPGACELARAAICAEAQGKLAPMDDALFRNQKDKLPLDAVAAEVGLDLAPFHACLRAPQTEDRLRSDIEAAMRVGLRATPTFLVNGRTYEGRLPVELLPPPVR